MAMKAGRVGVSPQSVDKRGRVNAGGLTPEERAKLNKALVSPVAAPSEKEIVAVGTGNDQIMIKIGTGLKLTGETSPFTLEAETSGGGGGLVAVLSALKLENADVHVVGSDFVLTDGTHNFYCFEIPAGAVTVGCLNLSGVKITATITDMQLDGLVKDVSKRIGSAGSHSNIVNHSGWNVAVNSGATYYCVYSDTQDLTKIYFYYI